MSQDYDAEKLENEYREHLKSILKFIEADCVNYLERLDRLRKLEEKLVDAGMCSVLSIDIMQIRQVKDFLLANEEAKKKVLGR